MEKEKKRDDRLPLPLDEQIKQAKKICEAQQVDKFRTDSSESNCLKKLIAAAPSDDGDEKRAGGRLEPDKIVKPKQHER